LFIALQHDKEQGYNLQSLSTRFVGLIPNEQTSNFSDKGRDKFYLLCSLYFVQVPTLRKIVSRFTEISVDESYI